MLPFFATSGYNLYLKSVHVYLQKMLSLEVEHAKVYAHFMLYVGLWGGISTDLVIEQCLMRSLKTKGGLTR